MKKQEKELSSIKRREQILDILNKDGQATVKALSERFGVSDMTIRRDFHVMEEQGFLNIHYGGASLKKLYPMGQSFSTRQEKLYRNKLDIARKAASYIKEGEVLFLDTSTTLLLMLRFLPDLNLTVVTNSFPVMEELYKNPKIQLHMAPGIYQEEYAGPLDYSTAEYVSRFHYDKAFFGASAVDASFGASATREIEAAVKRCVYANAEESYLLADHTKFGKKNLIKYNDVSDYRMIFTDDELVPEHRNQVIRQGGRFCE